MKLPVHEPPRDAHLAAALRTADPAAAGAHVDASDALARRIVEAARPGLLRRADRRRSWWEWTADWARIAVPVGVAATLAAGAILLASDQSDPVPFGESALVLGDGAGRSELAAELVPPATDEWLLQQVYDR